MNFKKLKLIDRIIIIGTLAGAIFIIGFVWTIKRTNRDYLLPADFEGWVTVIHQVPDAPALKVKDGVLQVEIPADGIVRTSSKLEQGWGRNQFFRKSGDTWEQVPNKTEVNGEPAIFMHRHEFYHYAHYAFLDTLPVGTDTIMFDGAHLIKYAEDDRVYNPGKKTIEVFYISKDAKPLTFNPPPNPNDLSDKPYREEYNR
jgi:hypothetical protein